MRAELAEVGARGVDSYPYSLGGSAAQARALKASGVDFFVGYLGVLNATRLGYILDAGLAFMPVTLAGEYEDGPADEVGQLASLGIPKGTTVWLDLEGMKAWKSDPATLIQKINLWADGIKLAGYEPGLYIAAPQPLTGPELYKLRVVRYWKAPSRIQSRDGALWDGPECGFCMYQLNPQGNWRDTGVFVDVDFVQKDFRGRLPSWVRA